MASKQSRIDPSSENFALAEPPPTLLDLLVGALHAAPGGWGDVANTLDMSNSVVNNQRTRHLATVAQQRYLEPGEGMPSSITPNRGALGSLLQSLGVLGEPEERPLSPEEQYAVSQGLLAKLGYAQKQANLGLTGAKTKQVEDETAYAPRRRALNEAGSVLPWGQEYGNTAAEDFARQFGIQIPALPPTRGVGQERGQRASSAQPKAAKIPEAWKTQLKVLNKMDEALMKSSTEPLYNKFTKEDAQRYLSLRQWLKDNMPEGEILPPIPEGVQKLLGEEAPSEGSGRGWGDTVKDLTGYLGFGSSKGGQSKGEAPLTSESPEALQPGEEVWIAAEPGPDGKRKMYGVMKGEKPPKGTIKAEGFAQGGIVTKPTLAMIGEQGPEAVVPLGGGGGSFNYDPTSPQTGLLDAIFNRGAGSLGVNAITKGIQQNYGAYRPEMGDPGAQITDFIKSTNRRMATKYPKAGSTMTKPVTRPIRQGQSPARQPNTPFQLPASDILATLLGFL